MVRVMDKSVLYLQDMEAPPRPSQRKPQPDFEYVATPSVAPRRPILGPPKKPQSKPQAKVEEKTQTEQYVQISLDEDVLNQLEEAADKVGLEVPEDLKKTYTVTPDRADETKSMLKEKFDAFLKALDEAYKANKKVQYQVALDENVLNQLETYATIYGLEVPEDLKKTYTVSSEEEKENIEKMLKEEFNEFVQKLNEVASASSSMDETAYWARLKGLSMKYHRPLPDVSLDLAEQFAMIPLQLRSSVSTYTSDDSLGNLGIDEDRAFKEARAEKLKKAQQKKTEQASNPYAGYEEYYKGLYELRKELDKGLSSVNYNNPQVRHRTRGAGLGSVDTSSLMKDLNNAQKAEDNSEDVIDLSPLTTNNPALMFPSDRTMTYEEILRDAEARSKVETLSGILSEELGLEPEPYTGPENGGLDDLTNWEKWKWSIKETGKDVARGFIGFFTFPVDLVMLAAQHDEWSWSDVKKGLIQSAKEGHLFGELAGSLLAGGLTSAITSAARPVVYEQPGGISGYRQVVSEIKIDGDDIARAIRSEAFDFDELTRITISKKYGLFGPKEIKVEKIPVKFTARSYESITAGDNIMATTRILEAPLGPDDAVNVATVKISQMASAGDDLARFTETTTKTLVNTDDIMNFLKGAKDGKAPNEVIKVVGYNTDDLTKTIITKEIYDDVTKTSIDIKKFLDDDILRVSKSSKPSTPSGSGTPLSTLNLDPSAPASSGSPSLKMVMRDVAKELEDVKFFVKEWKGQPVRVETGPDLIIPAAKVPTIKTSSRASTQPSFDISTEDLIRTDDLTRTGTGSGTDDTTKIIEDTRQDLNNILDTGQDTRIDLDFDLDVNQLLNQAQDIDIDFRTSERQKTIIKDIEDVDIDFNVRDIMKDLTRLDIDTRAILAEVLDFSYDIPPEEPRSPKYRKDRPKKTPKPKKKKTAPKKKAPKKRKSDDWKEWVGYEPLFKI